MDNKKVQNAVFAARKEKKFSQEELAQQVNVSRQTIIALEKGNYTPSIFLALKIAKCFNKKVEELFFIEENSNDK